MEQEIKEYLNGTYFDAGSGMFFSKVGHVADIRGWGHIQNMFKNPDQTIDFCKAEQFQDALGKWVADAINEKLNKDK